MVKVVIHFKILYKYNYNYFAYFLAFNKIVRGSRVGSMVYILNLSVDEIEKTAVLGSIVCWYFCGLGKKTQNKTNDVTIEWCYLISKC